MHADQVQASQHIPTSGQVVVVNAHPLTGVPAVLGEVAQDVEDLETFGLSWRQLRTIPLDQLTSQQPTLYQHIAALAQSRKTPTRLFLRFDTQGVDLLAERPLALSSAAALRYYYALWQDGSIAPREFLQTIPSDLCWQGRARLDPQHHDRLTHVTRGTPVSGGPVKGILERDQHLSSGGGRHDAGCLVLVDRVEAHHTRLFNEPGCTGVLALRGSPADHFALMARERDFPYMVLDNHALAETGLRCPGRIIPFGTFLTVDFSTGNVYLGDGVIAWAVEDPAMIAAQQLLAGQESPVPLRLNLDTMDDIPDGLPVDATGVGLLRTEHMVRRSGMHRVLRMFLESDDAHVRQEALEHWTGFFQREFTRCFVLVRGCPVTIRLLDYPLHELGGRLATEVNPMLGVRGVRQGLQWPALYRAQIEALLQAATWVQQQGHPLHTVEIMVPLVSFVEEVYTVRRWVEQALAVLPGGQSLPVKVGAMIETPAAASSAALLAKECDFLSFGTNDLTQFALGLSREDYPPVLWNYRQYHLLQHDPFQSLHPTILKMVREAAGHAKQTRPAIMLGLCGAHAADPQVFELCKTGLLDYLSVPRYHLPLVKLQAIQALGT